MKKTLALAAIALALSSAAFGPAPAPAFGQSQCLLTFITESIPDSTVGVPVQFSLEACCGTEPYRYQIVEGALPAGLHLNQNGKITGKPTEAADTTVFIRLTDAAGCSITQAFAVRANPAP